jgi:uncharacterized membrane protein
VANAVDRIGEALTGKVNLSGRERVLSVAAGVVLAVGGARRGGAAGIAAAATGTVLLHRGVTGRCMIFQALGIDHSGEGRARRGEMPASGPPRGVVLESSVTVARSADELYAYWRHLTHAPEFMHMVRKVELLEGGRSRWIAETPGGRVLEWTTELTEDVPGRRISWRSLPGSDLANRGSVEFLPGLHGGETVVRHRVEIDPPGGAVGEALLGAVGAIPEEMVRDDLRRFKALMETGMIATSAGPGTGNR